MRLLHAIFISLSFLFGAFTFAYAADNGVAMPQNGRRVVIYDSYSNDIAWSSSISEKVRDSLKQLFPDLKVIIGNAAADHARTRTSVMVRLKYSTVSYTGLSGDSLQKKVDSFFTDSDQPLCYVFIGDESFNIFRYMRMLDISSDPEQAPAVPEVVVDDIDYVSNLHDPFRNPFGTYYKPMPIMQSRKVEPEFPGVAMETHEPLSLVNMDLPVKENLDMILSFRPETKELVFLDSPYPMTHFVWESIDSVFRTLNTNGTELERILVTRKNVDSVYNVLSTRHPGRTYVSYCYPMLSDYSRLRQSSVDSILNLVGGDPIFYLKDRDTWRNREIGCYVRNEDAIVTNTVKCIVRYINGSKADTCINIRGGRHILNRTAMDYYKVPAIFSTTKDIQFENYPPSFLSKYRVEALVVLFILTIILASATVFQRYKRKSLKIDRISDKYKSLYEEMHFILGGSHFSLALYDSNGRKEFSDSPVMPTDLKLSGLLSKQGEKTLATSDACYSDAFINGKPSYVVVSKYKRDDGTYGFICAVSDTEELMNESRKVNDLNSLITFATRSLDVGMASFNICTGIFFANDVWFQYTGDNMPADETFEPSYPIFSDDDRKLVRSDFERRKKSPMPPFSLDVTLTSPDGSIHYVTYYAFSRGGVEADECDTILQIILNNDKSRQEDLELSNAEAAAKSAEEERTVFLNNVSHEIRTPLNAIVGFSKILSSDEQVSDEDKQMMKESIKMNKDLLFKLISDVLDISKFEAGSYKFNFKTIDLNEYFSNYIYEIKRQIKNQDIRAVFGKHSGSNYFYTDGVCLNKIFMNLISNACKFTDAGTISVGYTERSDSYSFYVKDTGCGIKESDIGRVFKSFEKIDRFTTGFGLGLSLTKAIVEGMGGMISILSDWQVGTTVWFSLPKTAVQPFSSESAEMIG
jgi:signal transduction histidine kinase